MRREGSRRGRRQKVRSLTIKRNGLKATGRQKGFKDALWKAEETEQFNRET